MSQTITDSITSAKPPKRRAGGAVKIALGLVLIASVVAFSGYYFFGWFKPDSATSTDKKNLIEVKVGPAKLTVIATGVVKPDREVKISPKQTGLLKTLLVKQGDYVKAGQLIATMDDSNLLGDAAAARGAYLASLDNFQKLKSGNRPQEIAAARFQEMKARSAERQARENIRRLQAQVEALTYQVKRDETFAERQTLLSKEGAVSDQAGIDATTQAEVTRSQLRAAKQEKEQAESALSQSHEDLNAIKEQHDLMRSGFRVEDIAQAEHNAMQAKGALMKVESLLEDTRIKAPFDGVITQKYADAGAIVTPTTSSATTSATSSSIVALAGKLEIVAQVAESNLPKISIGQPVEITATAFPDKVFHGKVVQIAPAAIVTSNVTTFEVHALPVDDNKHELLAGMNVSAKFVVGEVKDAITVPTVCVISRRGQAGVFVPGPNSEPTFKPVKTGPTVGKDIVIMSGLSKGEKVYQGLSRDQLAKEGYGGRMGGPGGPGGPPTGPGSALRMGGGGGGRRGMGP